MDDMTPEDAQEILELLDDETAIGQSDAQWALEILANMTTEWAVQYEEKKTTKYQPPAKRAGYPETGDKWIPCAPYWIARQTSWGDKDEAERLLGIYGADKPPRYRNARIVHRYVTEVTDGE